MKHNRTHHSNYTIGGFNMKQFFTLFLGMLLAMFTLCAEAGADPDGTEQLADLVACGGTPEEVLPVQCTNCYCGTRRTISPRHSHNVLSPRTPQHPASSVTGR